VNDATVFVLIMYKLSLCGNCAFSHQMKSVPKFTRGIFSVTGKWIEKLNRDTRLNVEKYWKDRLHDVDISMCNQVSSIFYVIS